MPPAVPELEFKDILVKNHGGGRLQSALVSYCNNPGKGLEARILLSLRKVFYLICYITCEGIEEGDL